MEHTCGLKGDATVWCWGGNDEGELGLGNTHNEYEAVPVPGLTDVICIEAGGTYYYDGTDTYESRGHSCASVDQGATYCWGRNTAGQLGDGSSTDRRSPQQVLLQSSTLQVTTGSQHTCAITADGRAWCWGENGMGALGNGDTSDQTTPVAVVDPY